MKRIVFFVGLLLLCLPSLSEACREFHSVAVDDHGNVQAGAAVTVTDATTNAVVTLYGEKGCGTPITNPVLTNAVGDYQFFVKDGVFNITVSKVGYNTHVIRNIAIISQFGENVHNVSEYGTLDLCVATTGVIDQIGATPTTLVITQGTFCTVNKTAPSTLNFVIEYPGTITVSTTKTLTIADPGHVIAPVNAQIFAGPGTVAFTNGGTVYASWWGANGISTTDATTAIQSALTAAQAGAGTVMLPGGTSKISAQLAITSTVTLRGTGWGSILKVDASATRFIPILVQGVAFAAVNGVVLRDFKLDGSSKGLLDAGLIQTNNAIDFLVEHLWITSGGTPGESGSQGVSGIAVSAGSLGEIGSQGTVSNNLIEATTKAGINWSSETLHGLFYGNIVRNCTGNTQTPGIQVFGGYNIKATGNTIYGNQGVGIFLGTSGGVGTYRNTRHAVIADNTIYNNGQGSVTGSGIFAANAATSTQQYGRVIISHNQIYSNGVGVNSYGIHVQNENNFLIEGNYVYNNTLSGILVEAAKNVSVMANILDSNNTANVANQSGVYLLPAATATMGSISVSNNKMFNGASQHQKYPIFYDNGAAQAVDDMVIRDNMGSGHETSDLFASTGTIPTKFTRGAPIIATGSLPAAGTPQDGLIVIEDNGAGDRNIVIYGGGQRFRLDGGAAF